MAFGAMVWRFAVDALPLTRGCALLASATLTPWRFAVDTLPLTRGCALLASVPSPLGGSLRYWRLLGSVDMVAS